MRLRSLVTVLNIELGLHSTHLDIHVYFLKLLSLCVKEMIGRVINTCY